MASRKILSELGSHRLPTNTTTRNHPVHRWLNFVAGFSPEFVGTALSEANLRPGSTLLDPFAGMATALVAANQYGINAIGYEAHPFFYDMALAKTTTRQISELETVARILGQLEPVRDVTEIWPESACIFLQKLVDPANLAQLAHARLLEEDCPNECRNLYRLVVTTLLEGAAGSKTDGIYKAPTSRKRSIDIAVSLEDTLSKIRHDIESLPPDVGRTWLFPKTSEVMSEVASNSVDICATSPPYLNNFDFAEMTRMELYFWNYAANWREITDRVRARLIINTTTAPTVARRQQDYWAGQLTADFVDELRPIKEDLTEQRRTRPGKKEYDSLIYPYFAQMKAVISEVQRVLCEGASFHMVVSDAALYGVHINTEQLLARLMTDSGLEVKEIHRLRDRGGRWVLAKRQGAAGGLGEFHIHSVKRK